MTTNIPSNSLLWVDDEHAEVPELIQKLGNNGWRVECADSYCDAKEKIANGNFSRMIVDMIIPFGVNKGTQAAAEATTYKDYFGLTLLNDLQKDVRWRASKAVVVLSVVEEERLAARVKKLIEAGLVQKQLSKKAGVTTDDVVKVIGRPPSINE